MEKIRLTKEEMKRIARSPGTHNLSMLIFEAILTGSFEFVKKPVKDKGFTYKLEKVPVDE